MSVQQRDQDILVGAIFGLVLGIISNLWVSVYDHLFLENAPPAFLFGLFILDTIGLIFIGCYLWNYIKRLGKGKGKMRGKASGTWNIQTSLCCHFDCVPCCSHSV